MNRGSEKLCVDFVRLMSGPGFIGVIYTSYLRVISGLHVKLSSQLPSSACHPLTTRSSFAPPSFHCAHESPHPAHNHGKDESQS